MLSWQASRDPNSPSLSEVRKLAGARFLRLDLANLDSVRAAADEFLQYVYLGV